MEGGSGSSSSQKIGGWVGLGVGLYVLWKEGRNRQCALKGNILLDISTEAISLIRAYFVGICISLVNPIVTFEEHPVYVNRGR